MAVDQRRKPKATGVPAANPPDIARKGVRKGRKEQITLTLTPELLARVDALAVRMGQSRAALINLAIFRLIEAETVPAEQTHIR